MTNKTISCNSCEDSGYRFDTLCPCRECKLGEEKQNEHDKQELSYLNKRARILRKRIKTYENV